MDPSKNSQKRIRGCVDGIDLFWAEETGCGAKAAKLSCASDRKEFLALLEDHVEAFDPDREEEDLRLAGKEQLIGKVMRSLQREIEQSSSVFGAAANCCLQSDSAVSMATSSSRLSDPEQLNMGNECICTGSAKKDRLGGNLLGACNEQSGGTVPISPWCVESDILQDCLNCDETENFNGILERVESSGCGSTELLDLDAWDLGGSGVSEEGLKANLELPTF